MVARSITKNGQCFLEGSVSTSAPGTSDHLHFALLRHGEGFRRQPCEDMRQDPIPDLDFG